MNKGGRHCIVFVVCQASAPPSTRCWDSQVMVEAPGPRGSVWCLGSTRGCSGHLWEAEASWRTEAGVGLGSCGIWGAAPL